MSNSLSTCWMVLTSLSALSATWALNFGRVCSFHRSDFEKLMNWWSRVESNHHLRLRRPSSYPLDHGTSALSREDPWVPRRMRLGKNKDAPALGFHFIAGPSDPTQPKSCGFAQDLAGFRVTTLDPLARIDRSRQSCGYRVDPCPRASRIRKNQRSAG